MVELNAGTTILLAYITSLCFSLGSMFIKQPKFMKKLPFYGYIYIGLLTMVNVPYYIGILFLFKMLHNMI